METKLCFTDRREFSKVALALSHPKKDTTDDALNKYYNAGEGMLNLSEGYNSDILNDRIPKIFDIIQQYQELFLSLTIVL